MPPFVTVFKESHMADPLTDKNLGYICLCSRTRLWVYLMVAYIFQNYISCRILVPRNSDHYTWSSYSALYSYINPVKEVRQWNRDWHKISHWALCQHYNFTLAFPCLSTILATRLEHSVSVFGVCSFNLQESEHVKKLYLPKYNQDIGDSSSLPLLISWWSICSEL